jgi:signal transduction histidine kinase
VDRLEAVTEEYLSFARLPRLVFAREDLNEILTGLLAFVRPELEESRIALQLQAADGPLPIRADEAQLRAALLNLVRNSREAMPQGGVLSVTTRRAADGMVEAEVRDTGGGIPAEALPRIFDPFYSTKEKGTGLGLAFAQQVFQEHGGSIACESRPGGGAVFTVRLPRAADERAAAAGVGEALEA